MTGTTMPCLCFSLSKWVTDAMPCQLVRAIKPLDCSYKRTRHGVIVVWTIHDEREDYDELNNKVKLSLLILNRNCKVSPPDDTKSTGNKMAIPQDWMARASKTGRSEVSNMHMIKGFLAQDQDVNVCKGGIRAKVWSWKTKLSFLYL